VDSPGASGQGPGPAADGRLPDRGACAGLRATTPRQRGSPGRGRPSLPRLRLSGDRGLQRQRARQHLDGARPIAPGDVQDVVAPRPATVAPRGIVTCSPVLASTAGVEMLRGGGSAVDAAIAAAAVLSVVYPHMTSIGGDSLWLVHPARTGGVRFLDGGGRAP